MQKIFRKNMTIIVSTAILIIMVINFVWTAFSLQNQQYDTFSAKIDQVIHMMENNKVELASIKMNLNEDYLTRAKAAAYVIEKNPEVLERIEELENLAQLLNVDEIHYIDADGIIRYSSVPEYIGLDFHEGEQTKDFLPLLEKNSRSEYIIQESQPNAAEGKMMKYVGVAVDDKQGIVQVGLEPIRELQAQKRNTYDYIFSRFPTDVGEQFFAIDCGSNELIAHSGEGAYEHVEHDEYRDVEGLKQCEDGEFVVLRDNTVSYVVTRQYGDVLIGASLPRKILYEDLWMNVTMTCLYLLLILAVVIALLDYLVSKKVIGGIHSILDELSEITDGNLDTTVAVKGNREFEQLSEGINTMVKSIINTSDRISKIIEMSDIPLAAFEYREDMHRVFVTSGLSELLNLGEKEAAKLYKDGRKFRRKIEQIMESPAEGEKDVFKMSDKCYIRIHLSEDNTGYLGVVTDVTTEIDEKHRMKYENDHDQLTGLCRYGYFKKSATELLGKMKENEICAAVMMDLDNFKNINDTYGHDVGDRYLIEFAQIMEQLPKEHCIPARRSGDEFCMFLYGLQGEEEAQALLGKFRESLQENPVELTPEIQQVIGVSGGVAVSVDKKENISDLLRLADEALYRAKKNEKGHFEMILGTEEKQ